MVKEIHFEIPIMTSRTHLKYKRVPVTLLEHQVHRARHSLVVGSQSRRPGFSLPAQAILQVMLMLGAGNMGPRRTKNISIIGLQSLLTSRKACNGIFFLSPHPAGREQTKKPKNRSCLVALQDMSLSSYPLQSLALEGGIVRTPERQNRA